MMANLISIISIPFYVKKYQVVTKKRQKLAKQFKCPFCANEECVECKMDHKSGIGSLSCRLCGASYQMPIHSLNEPIDVFSEWLDDCEAAQNPGAAAAAAGGAPAYDDEDDDELPESSGLGQRKQSAKPAASASNKNSNNARSIDLGDEDSDDDE